MAPRRDGLDVGFWLPRRLQSPRLDKVETIAPQVHLHRLRVPSAKDLDEEVVAWLREAYAVGCQEQLAG